MRSRLRTGGRARARSYVYEKFLAFTRACAWLWTHTPGLFELPHYQLRTLLLDSPTLVSLHHLSILDARHGFSYTHLRLPFGRCPHRLHAPPHHCCRFGHLSPSHRHRTHAALPHGHTYLDAGEPAHWTGHLLDTCLPLGCHQTHPCLTHTLTRIRVPAGQLRTPFLRTRGADLWTTVNRTFAWNCALDARCRTFFRARVRPLCLVHHPPRVPDGGRLVSLPLEFSFTLPPHTHLPPLEYTRSHFRATHAGLPYRRVCRTLFQLPHTRTRCAWTPRALALRGSPFLAVCVPFCPWADLGRTASRTTRVSRPLHWMPVGRTNTATVLPPAVACLTRCLCGTLQRGGTRTLYPPVRDPTYAARHARCLLRDIHL